jgi:hypothetical protein
MARVPVRRPLVNVPAEDSEDVPFDVPNPVTTLSVVPHLSPVAEIVTAIESRPPAPPRYYETPESNLRHMLETAAAEAERPGPTYISALRLHAALSRMVELMNVLPDAIDASTGELNAGLKALRNLLF